MADGKTIFNIPSFQYSNFPITFVSIFEISHFQVGSYWTKVQYANGQSRAMVIGNFLNICANK